ncbi:MAG: D-sedoheptulose 7-phosphate isomerase [Deltaproteobacteria bacterium]|jgi:D-sedoheptulose 7-phosphate isomerase|nr:D-sedoheptulose 7-phosphate isomerase [Deltaproteobacteria bacterium]
MSQIPQVADVLASFTTARNLLADFIESEGNMASVYQFAEKLAATLLSKNKILSCGNGGSMCDAMHFAEEFTGRFRDDRPSLSAIAISDPSYITCTANDYGYDDVYSRYVEGVGQKGDLLLGISTSGNSPNIIKAVSAAKKKGLYTVCLLGKDGGHLKDKADLSFIIPAKTSDRIQEIHIKIIHIAIELTEKIILSKDNYDSFRV